MADHSSPGKLAFRSDAGLGEAVASDGALVLGGPLVWVLRLELASK